MFKNSISLFLGISTYLALSPSVSAQGRPERGLYQIVSGRYIACCGIAGPIPQTLPNQSQKYIKLEVNAEQNLATMTFLGADMQTIFSVQACPPASRVYFDFNNGMISPDYIVFRSDFGPMPGQANWNYIVSNSANGLRLNGVLSTPMGFCADFPNRFTHTNVVAILMPTASIRVSAMEVCWLSAVNTSYQVQYRSSATTNEWRDLGVPVAGNGSTNCVADPLPVGDPRRTYRVLTLPGTITDPRN